MFEKKELPIGIEDFKVLIDNHYYYVDKTKFLCELTRNIGKVNLFTRPRRFGKTLNLSMIQRFFEKTDEDNAYLFDGLEVSKAGEQYMAYQGQYPVIKLSLKGMKKDTYSAAMKHFSSIIAQECARHMDIQGSDLLADVERERFQRLRNEKGNENDLCLSLKMLSDCLMRIHGKKAIVLIDEYDVPLENAHFKGYYDQMVGFIRSLFDNVLKTNDSLEMAVLTGCLRVSKESLFTGLNNLQISSIRSNEFSSYFGFTEQEVRNLAEYYDISDRFPVIKEWYDGYRFGKDEIYNPWSVLSFVREARHDNAFQPAPFWSNTSSNSIIHELIVKADEDTRDQIEELINGRYVVAPVHEDMVYADIEINREDIWSFLLFTGYLKPVESELRYNRLYCKMEIPNIEVESIYQQMIEQWFEETTRVESRDDLVEALLSKNVEKVNDIIGRWLDETISFYDAKEMYYHGFMSGLLSGLKGWKLVSNRESGDGRPDLLLLQRRPQDVAVIIEIKEPEEGRTLDALADQALKQIEEKRYESEPLNDGYTTIIKYGAAFRKKKCLIKLG